jgi:RNA polymerase sigma factor (sigma-70 family)
MPEPADADLLSDWLHRQRESAFHALVARYAGLVHMAAMRSCGDETLAAEASQLTFITLARKARALAARSSIAGWLHVTAVMHTKNLVRQHRRESHKRQLFRTHMDTRPPDTAAETWQRMQPVLDEALASLSAGDRETLLLRFYRSLSVKEIAAALGIATDAAQKRLDRATERLRRQLARRGCQVGGSLGTAMIAGLGADAQAIVPGVSLLASKALAAGTAGGATTLTTIALIAMTKKTAITAGAALLLAGAGAVVFINRDGSDKPAGNEESAAAKPKSPGSRLAPADESARAARSRPRDPAENPELVEKYGEARTNLSKHVAGGVISLLEDAVSMGEMATSGELGNAFGGRRGAVGMALGRMGRELNLTDEQQEKAAAAFAEYQKREIARSKENIERMKKDPTSLMKLMLASDSFARGEITEEQYKAAQTASGEELKGVLNPLDRENFRGGQPLKDEAFRSEFEALLDPTQKEAYDQQMAEREARESEQPDLSGIANMPSMELEQLDKTVASAKKLTTGLKSMMEGMGGLQDLGPLMEQQRQRRQGGGEGEAPPAE